MVLFSKILHRLKLYNNNKCGKLHEYRGQRFFSSSYELLYQIPIIISICVVFLGICRHLLLFSKNWNKEN